MKTNQGTPETISDTIKYMMCFGPAKDFPETGYHIMKDFISQKFTTAYLRMGQWRDGSSTRYTPEEILQELYKSLTEREK